MSLKQGRPTRVMIYAESAIYSGAESLLCEIAAGLAKDADLELSVAAPSTNLRLSTSLAEAAGVDGCLDVPAQPLPLAALHLLDPRRLRAVRRVIERARPEVMLINLPSAEYGATPLLVEPTAATVTVGLLHVSGGMGDLGFRAGRLRERLARRAVSRLDVACVLSEASVAEFRRRWAGPCTEARAIRMPSPNIATRDPQQARELLGLPLAVPIVGLAGRLSIKQKGHDTLVDAAELILARRPEVHFAIAGDGRDRNRLESMLEDRGVGSAFSLLGHVDPISDFLSAIDQIAIPSRFEGLPLIALEALQAGTPGVASSVDGLIDVWPSEWRVDVDDHVALAQAILRVFDLSAQRKRELIDRGRQLMEERTVLDASTDVADVLRALDG